MAKLNVNPTRMELSNLKKRQEIADRGYKLLKDKQDELMRQFIVRIKKNRELRRKVERELELSFKDFFLASGVMLPQMLEEAVSFADKATLEVEEKNIMGVRVPVLREKQKGSMSEHGFPYGYVHTTSELDDAIERLRGMMSVLLELAEVEKACQLMADEIEKTRRRVNALEHRTLPDLEETIKFIEMKLDENERSTITRLIKVKELIE